MAKQSKSKEAPSRKDMLLIYILLMVCAIFLWVIYLYTSINHRMDTIEATLQAATSGEMPATPSQIEKIMDDNNPFCYGYDPQGYKGYGIDMDRVTRACWNTTG